jgi:hypothetical protein
VRRAKPGRILAATRLIADARFDPAIQRHLQFEARFKFFDGQTHEGIVVQRHHLGILALVLHDSASIIYSVLSCTYSVLSCRFSKERNQRQPTMSLCPA